MPEGLRAASAIAAYLEANSADSLNLLRELEPYAVSNYLVLDDTTRINLELIANYSGDRKGSLIGGSRSHGDADRRAPTEAMAALSIAR